MKLFVAFAAVILAVSAASDQELFNEFKINHNKVYKNAIEERLRFVVFQSNLRKIEAHNAKFESGESSYTMGVNQFADWTSEEFVKYQTFKVPNITYISTFEVDPNYVGAATVDWREKGAVLGVKNQGQCGSCWAFSTTGSLEGQNAIKHSKKVSFSEQELVDCSSSYGNEGCNGGSMEAGYKYIQAKGIATESGYPYTAKDGTCKHPTRADIKVTGYTDVAKTEAALTAAIGSIGPISVAINADSIQLYNSGIFDEASCSTSLDHGVLAVGYGTEGKDYYIIKNSWGASWGEKGYFRLVRNKNKQCGIGMWNTYPHIQ